MKLSFANIRGVLEISGPMTMREVAQFFPDYPYRNISSAITSMRGFAKPVIYIEAWTMEGVGRRYPRAIYALGDQPDARKPRKVSNAVRCREYRARRRVPDVANSVFSWRPA